MHGGEHAVTLRGGTHLKRSGVDTTTFGETDRGGTRLAIFESLSHGRALALFTKILLALSQSLDLHS